MADKQKGTAALDGSKTCVDELTFVVSLGHSKPYVFDVLPWKSHTDVHKHVGKQAAQEADTAGGDVCPSV